MKPIYKILIGAGFAVGTYFLYRRMISQKMSLQGIDFLIRREGFKNKAYRDSKGLWTIGVGHLIKLPEESSLLTATLSNQQVKDLLIKDLPKYESAVNDTILFPLPQNEFDSLVSLCFNIGLNGFKNSTLARRINSKLSASEITNGFLMWNDGGLLTSRRLLESNLYQTGNYA